MRRGGVPTFYPHVLRHRSGQYNHQQVRYNHSQPTSTHNPKPLLHGNSHAPRKIFRGTRKTPQIPRYLYHCLTAMKRCASGESRSSKLSNFQNAWIHGFSSSMKNLATYRLGFLDVRIVTLPLSPLIIHISITFLHSKNLEAQGIKRESQDMVCTGNHNRYHTSSTIDLSTLLSLGKWLPT